MSEDFRTMPCPYCKKEILEDSVQCPKCKNYINEEETNASPRLPLWVIVTAVIMLVLFISTALFAPLR
jgi:predicted nucleic acid-binding Zn ribbon protein